MKPAKKNTASLADSLYQRIMAGDDFAKLAATFSNDYVSAASDGNIPDIGVGQYDPSFEKTIWALKDGSCKQTICNITWLSYCKKNSRQNLLSLMLLIKQIQMNCSKR